MDSEKPFRLRYSLKVIPYLKYTHKHTQIKKTHQNSQALTLTWGLWPTELTSITKISISRISFGILFPWCFPVFPRSFYTFFKSLIILHALIYYLFQIILSALGTEGVILLFFAFADSLWWCIFLWWIFLSLLFALCSTGMFATGAPCSLESIFIMRVCWDPRGFSSSGLPAPLLCCRITVML